MLDGHPDAALRNAFRSAAGWGYGERLFQAAKFVTEMEYQHLVFEEFGRKVQPAIRVFAAYDETLNGSIVSEFAHAVYRFGHSMLTESVDRVNANGTRNDISLLNAFLNPGEFNDGGPAGPLNARQAVGSIVRGMTSRSATSSTSSSRARCATACSVSRSTWPRSTWSAAVTRARRRSMRRARRSRRSIRRWLRTAAGRSSPSSCVIRSRSSTSSRRTEPTRRSPVSRRSRASGQPPRRSSMRRTPSSLTRWRS